MKENEKESKTIGSVEKAIRVLDIVASSEHGLGVTEISAALGCGVSATYHLLNTLRRGDLLQQDAQSKKYRLGVGLFRLGALAQRQNALTVIAQPFLEELSRSCMETSNLVVLQGQETVYVAQSESNNMVKMFTQLGARVPYYCTGGGKVILAFLPQETQQSTLAETKFVRFTEHTITRRADLVRELADIRARGCGFDREEREEGVTCIAAPVFNASGVPVAAMSVSGPTYRITHKGLERLVDSVQRSAAALSARLGFPAQPNE